MTFPLIVIPVNPLETVDVVLDICTLLVLVLLDGATNQC